MKRIKGIKFETNEKGERISVRVDIKLHGKMLLPFLKSIENEEPEVPEIIKLIENIP